MSRATGPVAPIAQASSSRLMRLLSLYLKADRLSPQQAHGFTLVELLVALIVSTIMVTILLGSAVQLMGTNQREAARSDTQRDVQAALDYIARDMREAVYVYDGDCLKTAGTKIISPAAPPVAADTCPGILQRLPAELNSTTNLPVLAFWRVDALPEPMTQDGGVCRSLPAARPAGSTATTPLRTIDSVPCSSRSMYTLVVYSVNTDNATTWAGRSRITRYQLPQYSYSGSSTLAITPGWVSPVAESGFVTWPRAASIVNRPGLTITEAEVQAKSVPTGGPATEWDNKVLVDFIDNQSPGVTGAEANLCPNAPAGTTGGSTPSGFIATPSPTGTYLATTIPKTVFYACVRGSGGATVNQEVLLRIRANGAGRGGVPLDRDLPLTMETRVLTRGILGKS
jgi:prepilin-type N-terminal cleavage/methylation domain-containing protein